MSKGTLWFFGRHSPISMRPGVVTKRFIDTTPCATVGVIGTAVAMMGSLQADLTLHHLLGLEPAVLGRVVTFDARRVAFGGFAETGAPVVGGGGIGAAATATVGAGGGGVTTAGGGGGALSTFVASAVRGFSGSPPLNAANAIPIAATAPAAAMRMFRFRPFEATAVAKSSTSPTSPTSLVSIVNAPGALGGSLGRKASTSWGWAEGFAWRAMRSMIPESSRFTPTRRARSGAGQILQQRRTSAACPEPAP